MSSSPKHARRPEERGITLIELLVTLALLGMLLALGFPSFSVWIHNTQVRSVGEALQNGLRTAQAEALRRNRSVVIAFTNTATAPLSAAGTWTAVTNGNNWWLQTVPQFGEAAEAIASGTFTDVASGVSLTSGLSAVCFNANGRVASPAGGTGISGGSCSAAPATFQIAHASADRNLTVTLKVGGQVRLCDPNRTLSSTTPDGC